MQELVKVVRADRDAFIKNVESLNRICPVLPDGALNAMRFLKRMELDLQDSCVKSIERLAGTMPLRLKIRVFLIFNSLPVEEIQDFPTHIPNLTRGLSDSDKVDVMATLFRVPADVRPGQAGRVVTYLRDHPGSRNKARVIDLLNTPLGEAIREIEEDSIEFRRQLARLKNLPGIGSERIELAMRELVQVDAAKRDAFIANVESLNRIGAVLPGDALNAMRFLKRMEIDLQDFCVESIERLVEGMDPELKGRVFTIFSHLAIEEIRDFPTHIPNLTSGLSNSDKVDVMVALFRVSAELRTHQAQRAVAYLNDHPEQRNRDRVIELLETPIGADIREIVEVENEMVGAHAAAGINVHAGERDNRTSEAIVLLRAATNARIGEDAGARSEVVLDQIELFSSGFITWSENPANAEQAGVVRRALGYEESEGFPPLFSREAHGRQIRVGDLDVVGEVFVARIWSYIESIGSEVEKDLAKESLFAALADSVNDYGRLVCNPGKIQRIIQRVLQGRLAGVNVDGMRFEIEEGEEEPLSGEEAIREFFNNEERRGIENFVELIRQAREFEGESPRVEAASFFRELLIYGAGGEMEGLPEEIIDLVDRGDFENERVRNYIEAIERGDILEG